MKEVLTKGLKGKLTSISTLIFLSDLLTKTPQIIEAFETGGGEDVSVIGVAAAIGMIWGVARRFLASYKYAD